MKEALKLWNGETKGNIKRYMNSIHFELETIYKKIQYDPLNVVLADKDLLPSKSYGLKNLFFYNKHPFGLDNYPSMLLHP